MKKAVVIWILKLVYGLPVGLFSHHILLFFLNIVTLVKGTIAWILIRSFLPDFIGIFIFVLILLIVVLGGHTVSQWHFGMCTKLWEWEDKNRLWKSGAILTSLALYWRHWQYWRPTDVAGAMVAKLTSPVLLALYWHHWRYWRYTDVTGATGAILPSLALLKK